MAAIVAAEKLWTVASPEELSKRLQDSGLMKELVRQAQWTVDEFQYKSPDLSGFLACPSGSLNPFSPIGKCGQLGCRLQAADQFTKSVALYTDSVVVPDVLTAAFMSAPADIEQLHVLIAVFAHTLPLIEAGVVRFASPVFRYCEDCHGRVQKRVGAAVDRILNEARPSLEVEYLPKSGIVTIQSPVLSPDAAHPLVGMFKLSRKQARQLGLKAGGGNSKARDLMLPELASKLKHDVGTILFEMSTAQKTGATLLASSRVELLSVSDLADSRPELANLEQWEARRSVRLPWLRELTTRECLILREEAHSALPRLRQMLAEKLGSRDQSQDVASLAAELRAQVAEVEEEIKAIRDLGEPRYRGALEGLSLAFVLYGLASGVPVVAGAGLAAFLASLAHLQTGARDISERKVEVAAAPAFVLVKAKELLQRRHPL